MPTPLLLCLAGLIGQVGAAQTSSTPLVLAPAATQIVLVDAFIADKKGRPVSNLTRQDFELFEDGQRVEVTGFVPPRVASSVATAASPIEVGATPEGATLKDSATEPMTVVIYVDRQLLSPGGRVRSLAQASSLARSHLALGARVLVVAEEKGLRPMTTLTTNPDEVQAALDRILHWATQSPGFMEGRRAMSDIQTTIEGDALMDCDCVCSLPQVFSIIRTYAGWRAIDVQQARDRLASLIDVLVGVSGRKALIYVSEGLEQRPGIHLFDQIGTICPEVWHKEGSTIFSAMQEFETSAVMQDVAARANAARVTFYPIDARGLEAPSMSDISNNSKKFTPSFMNDRIRDANLANQYQLLAEETGGFAMIRGLDPAAAMRRFGAEALGHYILGFSPGAKADGQLHTIGIGLKTRRDVEMRYRRSYLRTETFARRAQRALSTLFFGLEEDGLGATVEITRPAEITASVPSAIVRIGVPLARLTIETTSEGKQARVRVVVALRSTGDAASKPAVVRDKEFSILVASDGFADGPPHEIVIDVPITASGYEFSIGLEDAVSGRSTYLRKVLGPAR